jgi:hypothetical protein
MYVVGVVGSGFGNQRPEGGYVITKRQRGNAERIVQLAYEFGHLPCNEHGQTTNDLLNLSIPCAQLVVAGIVTGVDPKTYDGINNQAVEDVERYCRKAVDLATEEHGRGWWTDRAAELL